ncbi:MAG: RNA polymerase sigma factor [Acidobacteria bacterium]|nr:RNA polymerase sigma factor [Acidobacteriota bacterium]
MDDDAVTIDRVLGGDSDAFRFLVERHGRAVFRLAYRLTRSQQDADDVVQETFLRAYRHLPSFDARSSFSTWLFRIATNSACDLMRRSMRHRTEELDEMSEPVVSDGDPAMRIGFRAALERGMERLTGSERTAFVLRHFEGMSIDEISAVLGTETSATKQAVFRAVRKLRQVLDPLVRAT